MEILDIGSGELLLIFLLAFVLIGPNKLGDTGRVIGRWLNKLFKSDAWMTIREISNAVFHLPTTLAKEASLEELNREMQVNPDLVNAKPRVIHSPRRDHTAGEAVVNSILPPPRSQPILVNTPAQPPSAKKPAAKPAPKKKSQTKEKKTKPAAKPSLRGKKRTDA